MSALKPLFKKPTKQNFMFNGEYNDSLALPPIEDEIREVLLLLQNRRKKFKNVRYSILYCKNKLYPQYLISTNSVASKGELWYNISVELFNCLAEGLEFGLAHTVDKLLIYSTNSFTLTDVINMVNVYSRTNIINTIIKNIK